MNTDWLDERIRLGEVPPESREAAAARAGSAEGKRAQADIALSDASILERLPPERMAGRIAGRLRAGTARRKLAWNSPRVLVPALATLAICAALAPRLAGTVLAPGAAAADATDSVMTEEPSAAAAAAEPAAPSEDPVPRTPRAAAPEVVASAPVGDDGIRFRGSGELSVLRVGPDGVVAPCGTRIDAGSTLRVVAPGAAHAGVWSIDESGSIQRHWPLSGDSSKALPAGPLPRDWVTDHASGWDRFVLVESPERFSLARAEAHLRGLVAAHRAKDGRISLPGTMAASSVLVERSER